MSLQNRLATERSPYLRQHAGNPVEWYPWGEEAFARARGEQKPIFLSIGYSTCHWCHVMEHESFESPAVAAFLRDHFISIKVDREERPDIDQVYMAFVQATTGHGGWPLSVWLTPELRPFYGGTYFPPSDHPGRPSFLFVLRRLAELWQTERAQIEKQAGAVIEALRQEQTGLGTGTDRSIAVARSKALAQNARLFDSAHGGFGSVPKFPRVANLEFLLALAGPVETGAADDGALARSLALHTLRQMARGGMYDHLGGGFHRYSVDAAWHVPHFEKMLYDQAQLISVYLRAFAQTGDPVFAATARRALHYVRTDLTGPNGGFYSAEDADSLPTATSDHKLEGAFYVWSADEIRQVLGAELAREFNLFFGVETDGNVDPAADPQGELSGQNVLIQRRSLSDAAAELGKSPAELETRLGKASALLLARRGLRPRPHLDDKILTAWNGMMLGAAARTFQVLGDAGALGAAQQAATFLRKNLYDDATGTLGRSDRGSATPPIPGFAADYAALIGGLLDLYQADFDTRWLAWAQRLQARLDANFWDAAGGGYFSTTTLDPTILLRLKDDYDGAEPTPSSIAAGNLVRLAELGLGDAYRRRAEQTIAAFSPRWHEQPLALPGLLTAATRLEAPPRLLILHAPAPDDPGLAALLAAVRREPQTTIDLPIIRISTVAEREFFAVENGAVRNLPERANVATAYLCENFTCRLPITGPAELSRALQAGGQRSENAG